ncbi:hypothetical protein BH09DEP1_BH09DEP1_2110 [soil metagenome]
MVKKNKCFGSTLESFLEEEGILEEVRAEALKDTIAHQLTKAMKQKKISKTTLAKKMKTSRAVLDRLLNPKNTSVTLNTLEKAAHAVGKKLYISFD